MADRTGRSRTPQAGSVQRRSDSVRNQAEEQPTSDATVRIEGDNMRNSGTGFNPDIPTGFDNPRPVGDGELGRPQRDRDDADRE